MEREISPAAWFLVAIASLGILVSLPEPAPCGPQMTVMPAIHSQASPAYDFNAVDVRGWNLETTKEYMLASFEGIVNRENATVFLINNRDTLAWLEDLNDNGYNGTIASITDFPSLLMEYTTCIEGIIIWDDLPQSANVATPLCGIYRSLMVHANIYNEVMAWPALAGKPVKVNLTAEYLTQGFNSTTHIADVYRWAFDKYFGMCNQSALGMYDAHHPGHLRSLLCSDSVFTFWQPMYCEGDDERAPDDAKQQDTFTYMLEHSPDNMIVYGYMFPRGCNEHPVVSRLSSHGKFLVPSDWYHHGPFWKHLPVPANFTFTQEASRNVTSITLENKLYVAGIYSDGDNMQYVANFMRSGLWHGKHGTVPTTFEMSPSIANMAPAMAMLYYREMTPNDYFVNGVGGKGYVKSDYATPEYFTTFWRDTRDLMRVLDQREVRTWNSGDLNRIAHIMNEEVNNGATPQADMMVEGYGSSTPRHPTNVGKVPYIGMYSYNARSEEEFSDDKHQLLDILAMRNPTKPQFIVLHLIAWNAPYDVWVEFVNIMTAESNGNIVFVTAGQMSRLVAGINFMGLSFAEYIPNILFLACASIGMLVCLYRKRAALLSR